MATALPPLVPAETGSVMGARIRAHDWASTPLGPLEAWPPALRYAVDLCERATHPVAIFWGPDFRLIYNDAFARGPAARHPDALGRPGIEVFEDMWSTLGAHLKRVWETGAGHKAPEHMLPTVMDGIEQDVCWTYGLTPIFDSDRRILAIYSPGFEISGNVQAERRLSFQITLADRLRRLGDPNRIISSAAELLGNYLGVMRVGYGDISANQKEVFFLSDWTSGEDVQTLAGRHDPLDRMGPRALAVLRSGETVMVPDIERSLREARADMEMWEEIGVRAFIVVPLIRNRKLKALFYVHSPEPRIWKKSEAAITRDAAERTWAALERTAAEQSLRESEDHYRHTVELNPQITWTALPDGRVNRIARRWQDWTGLRGLGEEWVSAIHPKDLDKTMEAWAESVRTGKPCDVEQRVRLKDGGYRWVRSRAYPRRTEQGDICLWYGSTEDIHERKIGEEHQRLLINELNHRVKNTLATVQAIAFQTFKGNLSLSEARGKFEARLLALSHAHNLLTEENWGGASLNRIAAGSLAHMDEDRIRIEGPSIWLTPQAALALALAFHELATNAVKYGALSQDAGNVAIRWSVAGDRLRLTWSERNGPPVLHPESRGFGSRLIERGLAGEFGGRAEMRFDKTGLSCLIEMSMEAIRAGRADDA